MRADDLARSLREVGLSNADLARGIGKAQPTVSLYVSGTRAIPQGVARLIRAFLADEKKRRALDRAATAIGSVVVREILKLSKAVALHDAERGDPPGVSAR